MSASSASPARPITIGWASASITPDKPVQLHGQFHERVSEYVNDTCTATAMALQSEPAAGAGEQAIMISLDLVNISREIVDAVRARVGKAVPDFDARKLLINTTHTHTAPTMMEGLYPEPAQGVMRPSEYAAFLIDILTKLAADAWAARRPAGISTALGHAAVGFNRRVTYRDGSAQMYGDSGRDDFAGIEAGMDPGVELLYTFDEHDTLTGVVVNIACPSQVVEGQSFISADFWHPAREGIRAALGADVFVYPMCSAAGDQSPRDLVRRNRGEPSMRQIEGMNEMGRRIALAITDAFAHSRGPTSREVVFQHHTEDLSLPMRKATAAEAEHARRWLEELTTDGEPDPASREGRLVTRQRKAIERYETQGDDPRFTIDMHVLRLGDIAIATNPFELYLEFGQRIKGRSKAHQTFVVQLTNDRALYLPTERAVAGGHYGAMIYDNTVGPAGGDALVERQVEMINGMFGEAE